MRAEFLESTGSQCIDTPYVIDNTWGAKIKFEQQNPQSGNVCLLGSYRPYFVAPRFYTNNSIVGGFGVGGLLSLKPATWTAGVHISSLNYSADGLMRVDGYVAELNKNIAQSGVARLSLFGYNNSETESFDVLLKGNIKLYSVELTKAAEQIAHIIPALDRQGVPCMFDKVTKTPFYNSGSGPFIAGFTLAQVAQLGRKLPNTGGTLTVSLPDGYDMDESVVNSLAEAEAKGWVLTIQTYAAATAAATFALRRVWVRRVQDEHGSYVAADGSRWLVEWCVDVIGADPDALGYERFRSVEAATAYWELEPYIDPNAEELLTVEEQS